MLDQRKQLDCVVYSSLGILLLIYSNEAIRISQLNLPTITTTTTNDPFLNHPPSGSLWSTQKYHGIGGPFGHRPPNRTTTTTTAPPTIATAPKPAPVSVPDLDRPPSCGVVDVGGYKIVGGKEVPRGSYPWMVSFGIYGRHVCGGSLIDSQHVLTAAHCFNDMRHQSVIVRLGDHNLSTTTEAQHQVRRIKRLHKHKAFNRVTIKHDIALFLLDKPVEFSSRFPNIAPACLANEDDYGIGTGTGTHEKYDMGRTNGTVSGWGSEVVKGLEWSTLRSVTVPIWTNKDCAEKYGAIGYSITDYELCAGSETADSCSADSGGPLMIQRRPGEPLIQIGIVSWGYGCGGKYPGVYTRVDKYRDWIEHAKARLLVHF